MDLTFSDRAKIIWGNRRDVMRANFATSLHKRGHSFLASIYPFAGGRVAAEALMKGTAVPQLDRCVTS
jgi:hypothetical protein